VSGRAGVPVDRRRGRSAGWRGSRRYNRPVRGHAGAAAEG